MTPVQVIDAIVLGLAQDPAVQRVSLFGSRARGDAEPRSDIDIAVVAPGLSEAGWLRLQERVEALDTLLKIDLVRLDRASDGLVEEVLTHGKLLYMSDEKIRQSLRNLGHALDRLTEALDEPQSNTLAIDGTIQRFEFVIELFWKTLKRMLAAEGIQALTPKETLKEAYKAGWLDDEALWLRMLNDRNETSHIYDEETARRIYGNIRDYDPALRRMFVKLAQRLDRGSGPEEGAKTN